MSGTYNFFHFTVAFLVRITFQEIFLAQSNSDKQCSQCDTSLQTLKSADDVVFMCYYADDDDDVVFICYYADADDDDDVLYVTMMLLMATTV